MSMRALVSRLSSPLRVPLPASSLWFAVLLGATAAAISASRQDDEVIKPGRELKKGLIRHEVRMTIPHDAENPEQDHYAESEKHEFLESAFVSTADLHKEAAPNARPPDHADHDDVGAATNTSSSLVVRSSSLSARADSCPSDTEYSSRFCVKNGGGKCHQQPNAQGKFAAGEIKSDGSGNYFPVYGTTSEVGSFPAGDCYYQGRLWYSTDVQPGGRETCRKACHRAQGCTHYSYSHDPHATAKVSLYKQTDHCMLFNNCAWVTVDNKYDWPDSWLEGTTGAYLNNAKVYACTKLCPTNCASQGGYTNLKGEVMVKNLL